MRRRRPPLAALLLALATAACAGMADGPACPAPRLVVDVGHTPQAPGAIAASGATEYSFNTNFADRLSERLAARGAAPAVVRIAGDDPKLDRRVAAIAAAAPTLVVSIHHDSVQARYLKPWLVDGVERSYTGHAAGFSLFVPTATPPAAASLEAARRIADALSGAGERPSRHHGEPIEGEGRRLLDPRRGIYAGDFLKILRTAEAPIVLVEVGVIKNPVEERRLADPGTIDRLAGAVAAAAISAPCPAIPR